MVTCNVSNKKGSSLQETVMAAHSLMPFKGGFGPVLHDKHHKSFFLTEETVITELNCI